MNDLESRPPLEFKFELKLKGCDIVFRDGMSPGVVFEEVADFSLIPTREDYFVARALLEHESRFIEKNIEVIVTPLDGESIPRQEV